MRILLITLLNNIQGDLKNLEKPDSKDKIGNILDLRIFKKVKRPHHKKD